MPHIESPLPAKKAANALGNRNEKNMFVCKELCESSSGEIAFIPKKGQAQMITMLAILSKRILKLFMIKIYVLCKIIFRPLFDSAISNSTSNIRL